MSQNEDFEWIQRYNWDWNIRIYKNSGFAAFNWNSILKIAEFRDELLPISHIYQKNNSKHIHTAGRMFFLLIVSPTFNANLQRCWKFTTKSDRNQKWQFLKFGSFLKLRSLCPYNMYVVYNPKNRIPKRNGKYHKIWSREKDFKDLR